MVLNSGTNFHKQIWVKVGKGGNEFSNCQHTHTQLFKTHVYFPFFFEASDTITNLHVALDRYKAQIEALEGMKVEVGDHTKVTKFRTSIYFFCSCLHFWRLSVSF